MNDLSVPSRIHEKLVRRFFVLYRAAAIICSVFNLKEWFLPVVRIEIYKGFDAGYRKKILDGVHQALVDSFKIPDSDRNQHYAR